MPATGSGTPELSADTGKAASEPEHFFRSPEFFDAEGVTHSLLLTEGGPVLPLLVREIPGTELSDAASPYGFPGAASADFGPVDPTALDWSLSGLVSVFVRDAIGVPPSLTGGSERSRVWIADPARESGVRKRLREQIRRNQRLGWEVEVVHGPEVTSTQLAGFSRAYAETMSRTGAAPRYLFEDSYFQTLLGSQAAWLVLARNQAEIRAGAIAVRSDGILHYFLGGTAESGLADSPMKNLFDSMIGLSEDLGLPLNLGGGVTPDDSLDRFKRGFANDDLPFVTHELICDPEAYQRLSGPEASDPPGNFFPAYRSVG
jgi:hypothetical protein